MDNIFWIFYQVLGSLGAKGGPWDAEMQWKFPTMREYRLRGTYLHIKESVLGEFLANKVHKIHGEYALDVLSRAGVAGGKGCYFGVLRCKGTDWENRLRIGKESASSEQN